MEESRRGQFDELPVDKLERKAGLLRKVEVLIEAENCLCGHQRLSCLIIAKLHSGCAGTSPYDHGTVFAVAFAGTGTGPGVRRFASSIPALAISRPAVGTRFE